MTTSLRIASALAGSLAAVSLVTTPTGCASTSSGSGAPRPSAYQVDSVPDDFTLAVTVYAPMGMSPRAVQRLPAAERPARYILDPSGVLRSDVAFDSFGVPARLSDDSFPGQTRLLSEREVAALWNDLQTAGLLRRDHPASVGRIGPLADPSQFDAEAIVTAPPTHSVFFAAGGINRTLALSGTDAQASKQIVERLASLSWMAP